MKIGEYEIVKLLGRGGMSEVYEAVNPRLGSRHALKLFACDKNESDVCGRFLVEGKLLARLSHPRIVKVTDFGTDAESGRPYMVMELVLNPRSEVQLLSDVDAGTVDEDTVGKWYDDIRDGLEYIHANGVIHRDLKLQNVLVGPDGHAVIADFGISKVFDATGDGTKVVDAAKTIAKLHDGRELVMGSIGYMAPELEMGVAASPQSDWYALGVIAYRLLTGTWCDARTDVTGVLETYDKAWSRIIPSLLHSHPAARKCISYSETVQADHELMEFGLEEKCAETEVGEKRLRVITRCLALGIAASVAALALVSVRYSDECGRLRSENDGLHAANGRLQGRLDAVADSGVGRMRYDFDSLFDIPKNAGGEAKFNAEELVVPALDDVRKARNDLLVITYDVFRELREHPNEWDKAKDALERLKQFFDKDDDRYGECEWPDGYCCSCDNFEVTLWMLNRATDRMEDL